MPSITFVWGGPSGSAEGSVRTSSTTRCLELRRTKPRDSNRVQRWRAAVIVLAGVIAVSCTGARAPAHRDAAEQSTSSLTSPTSTSSTADLATAGPVAVIDHGNRRRPWVALTFDSNLTTSMIAELDRHEVASFDNTAVLDVLDRLDVPATFFLAGLWIERYPDTVRRIVADPKFEVASHSYAHIAFAPRCYHLGVLPTSAMAADVERSEALLHRFSDHPTRYFRFPGGCYTTTALAAIAPTGVTVIGFDVAGGDAFGTSVASIVSSVLRHTQNGSIIVLHITGGNTAPLTAQALPAVIAGLRARGLRLVRVSELLEADDFR